jgi:1-deoxy-D-xylulose-5-phosphate reductoisomerase
MPQGIAILGSTGSIGRNALRVIEALGPEYQVVALSAHRNVELLAQQARRYKPKLVAVTNKDSADQFHALMDGEVRMLSGPDCLTGLVQCDQVDTVLTAVVGAAGLSAVMAAAATGKRIAVANKEPLVIAGELLTRSIREHGSTLLPIDSEHSAVFQAMQSGGVGAKGPPTRDSALGTPIVIHPYSESC